MAIGRTPIFLQSVANHPKVFPSISMAGQGPIDLESLWPHCVAVQFERGGFLFHQLGTGYYEVHTLFLPKTREVDDCARQALHHMFTATDAMEIVTRVPADLPHALALAKRGGFTERFRRFGAWPRDGYDVDVVYLGLTIDDWARENRDLLELGQRFHGMHEHKNHTEDPIHDAYVGLGLACWQASQPDKGLWLYNRWAVFAGYEPQEMTAGAIHFDGVALTMRDGEFVIEEMPPCL